MYAPEGIVSAATLIAPILLGIASLVVSARSPWTARFLAVPALLIGFLFSVALIPNGPGYGGIWLLLYGPTLLILGIVGLVRSISDRRPRQG